jgi:hypothetical protein
VRIVEGSGVAAGGFRNGAGGFSGLDEVALCAEAVDEEQPQALVGGGGMQEEAVDWCQFSAEGVVLGVADEAEARACGSGFIRSSQRFMTSWIDAKSAESESAADDSSWWIGQARAGRALVRARQSPRAARAVLSHERPRSPAHPCDGVMRIGRPDRETLPGRAEAPSMENRLPGVRSEPPIVARSPPHRDAEPQADGTD